jgi:beta-lactamase class A
MPDTPEQHLAQEYLAEEPGVYGFVVLEADGSLVVSINSKTPFVTASLYKLILMADIFQRVEMGTISLDDTIPLPSHAFIEGMDNYFTWDQIGAPITVREYLFAVGAWSSNVAARTLLDLTSPGALRNTALAIGMTDTYLFVSLNEVPDWPPAPGIDAPPEEFDLALACVEESAMEGPVNITTPLDMARYQIAIANDTLLSPWVSEQVALVLQDQAIRDRIPALLDGSVFVINKPGNLVDVVNDVGVLFLPGGPRAIAVLSEAIPNWERATAVEQYLALIATGWVEYIPTAIWVREPA